MTRMIRKGEGKGCDGRGGKNGAEEEGVGRRM
jgi:hypothetical protein